MGDEAVVVAVAAAAAAAAAAPARATVRAMPARAGFAARRPRLSAPCPRWRVRAFPPSLTVALHRVVARIQQRAAGARQFFAGRLAHSLLQHARDRPGGRTRRIGEDRLHLETLTVVIR